MFRIAVTGGIACGKSLVGEVLAAEGIPVCDTDRLAHAALASDTAAHRKVVRAFGRGILAADGEIDRRALARDVFGNAAHRLRLERIIHPVVMRQVGRWLKEQARHGAPMAAALVPLLYEARLERNWDAVICVAAPPRRQRTWLEARGLNRREADARVAAQLPQAEKMKRAHYVVYNCGNQELLAEQVKRIVRSINGE